ncbi:MAG: ATP-binding cassette domain-containing protein, partial [Jatrophihabitans sp.]|uniref:ATP-binding cassette domain-containing protein n=1 Tax=Jatrophihabitans sp. TaxID=1932789 RepID=UPI003F7D0178
MTTVDATPPAPQVVVGARSGRATSAPAIETVGLTKWFGRTLALDHLDLRVERGEVLGYLGPNGAGKSTTIQLLLGLIRPTAGSARIFGRDAWGDAAVAHRRLASVPNDVSLWPALTGQQVLDLLAHLHGDSDRRYRADLLER